MSEDCKGGAQEEDTTVWCTRSSNVDGSLPRCETLKFRSTVEFRSPGTGRLDNVSRGEDDSITFQSPVSGNVVASFSASSFNDGCFATLARVLCRGEIRHPPFAITFVLGTQVLASVARAVSTDVNFVGPTCLCQVAMELFFAAVFRTTSLLVSVASLLWPVFSMVTHGEVMFLLGLVAEFMFEERPHTALVPLLQTCTTFGVWHLVLQNHLDRFGVS